MVKKPRAEKYQVEVEQWLASVGQKPFGHGRCRSGLEVLSAVFPDNRSQLAVQHVEDSGEVRFKVLNPTLRDQPNISVRARLQEHLVEWRDHSENGRTLLRSPLSVPATVPGDDFRVHRGFTARFTVSRSGMETVLTELQVDGESDTIHEAQSEIHVDLTTPGSARGRAKKTAPLLFVCYAHADRPWFDQFVRMLQPAVDAGKIELWADHKIPPGADWHAEIAAALEACDAALLLVTPHFHGSGFITKVEHKTLRERSTRIYWVSLISSLFEETHLAGIQCVNDAQRPITSFELRLHDQHIKEACRKIVDDLHPRPVAPST
jgi:hypothetical protein